MQKKILADINIKPSPWIVNGLELLFKNKKDLMVLDLACGNGRHSIYIASKNMHVVAIDKNLERLKKFASNKKIKTICFDLEKNNYWPFKNKFDIVLVVNYLYRRNFAKILKLVKLNGYLIYETFAEGNEVYGSPKNPNFLLRKNELLELVGKEFKIQKYFHKYFKNPKSSVKQGCIAKRVASKNEATLKNN